MDQVSKERLRIEYCKIGLQLTGILTKRETKINRNEELKKHELERVLDI